MEGFFNQPDLADLRLVLQTSHGGSLLADEGRCAELSQNDARSLYTHKIILASKSPVLKAMLLRAKELRDVQAKGDGSCVIALVEEFKVLDSLTAFSSFFSAFFFSVGQTQIGKKKRSAGRGSGSTPPEHQLPDLQLEALELPVEQEELLACEVLFRSMYSNDLAEEVASALSSEQGAGVNKVILLVQVYRLADRLEVCTDQCAQAISALSSEDCESVDAVNYVFSLKEAAPALAEHSTIKALLEKCMSQLVERFGAVWKLFCSNSLMQEFKQLDFLTALYFFNSDNLEVVFSENEILLLMARWIGKDWASRVSKEKVEAFLNALRLGHLSTSFISHLSDIAPWLPVDLVMLRHAAAWKTYHTKCPEKAASMPASLQSAYGRSAAWFKDNRKYWGLTNGAIHDFWFSEGDLAQLLTLVQHAGTLDGRHTIRGADWAVINGYDIFHRLSVQIVSDSSSKTFVLSVGFEFTTSAFYVSKGIKTLALVRADCVLGKGTVYKGSVDELLHGEHSWEVARVDSLDDFSCLDSYLDEEGKLPMRVTFHTID